MNTLIYETEGAIATIILNRPEVFNAINEEMRRELLEAIERTERDKNIRVVIIKGNGPGFCAGADLSEGLGKRPVEEQLEHEYKPFLMAIDRGDNLYIAQVHKSAAGIGGALAMTCDFCVMADDANIYLAFAAIGLVPDGGKTWHLLTGMGYSRALETIITGRKILADECLALGLVNKTVPENELENTTKDWALQLAKGAPLAQQAAKRILKRVGNVSFGEAISLEAIEQGPLTRSEDCRNAVDAFLNKQQPEFEGK